MPGDYLGYKDISHFSGFISGFAVINTSTIGIAPYNVKPYVNLYLLSVRYNLYIYQGPFTTPIDTAMMRVSLIFNNPTQPGMTTDVITPVGETRIACKNAQPCETPIFRTMPANETFDLFAGGNIWLPRSTGTVVWAIGVDLYYKVKRFGF